MAVPASVVQPANPPATASGKTGRAGGQVGHHDCPGGGGHLRPDGNFIHGAVTANTDPFLRMDDAKLDARAFHFVARPYAVTGKGYVFQEQALSVAGHERALVVYRL